MTPQPPTLLTEEQKNALAVELRQQLLDLTRKMDQLGISATDRSPKPVRAPDGGPVSNAHKYLRTQLVQTVEVKLKHHNGARAVIRKVDFDPELHEKVVHKQRVRTRLEDKPVAIDGPAIKVGHETRDELLTMTIPMLRALPEAALLKDAPDRKEELVDAVLTLRESLSGAGLAT